MKSTRSITTIVFGGLLAMALVGCGGDGKNTGASSSSPAAASLPPVVSSSSSSSISSSATSSVVTSSSSSVASSNAAVVVATLARTAAFNGDGLRLDKEGNVFVGTSKGHTIFKVTTTGEITLFASLASGSANGSYFDSKGNLFVANENAGIVHKITPDGTVSDYITGLDGPAGIYVDEQDNMFISLFGYSNPAAKVLKVTPDMTTTTYASGNGLTNVVGITGDGHGRYFASNFYTGEIFEITDGVVKQIGASETRVNHIQYANGYIYTPNPLDQVVRRMDMEGKFELLAGTKSVAGSDDGDGEVARFSRPNSIDISKDGKTLYILDFNTGDVRTLTLNQ